MLPYVEQQVVWEAGPVVAVGAELSVFFCPSRRAPQSVEFIDKFEPQLTGGSLRHGLCDYAASNRELTARSSDSRRLALKRLPMARRTPC